MRPRFIGLRACRPTMRPRFSGLRACRPTMRPRFSGLRACRPTMRARFSGLRASQTDDAPPLQRSAGMQTDDARPLQRSAGMQTDDAPPLQRSAGMQTDDAPPLQRSAGMQTAVCAPASAVCGRADRLWAHRISGLKACRPPFRGRMARGLLPSSGPASRSAVWRGRSRGAACAAPRDPTARDQPPPPASLPPVTLTACSRHCSAATVPWGGEPLTNSMVFGSAQPSFVAAAPCT